MTATPADMTQTAMTQIAATQTSAIQAAAIHAAALQIEALDVVYRVRGRDMTVLSDVRFSIAPGEAYGLVGESGSGKSTVALAAQRVLPPAGRVVGGRISIAGQSVMDLGADALRRLRARDVSMVYQDPGKALNPSITVGRQMREAFEVLGVRGAAAREKAEAMLATVRIAGPARVMASYPHQLSGGMQQRVVIAMALAKNPSLLVLDEPTTGLDATIEAEVLDLVAALQREFKTAILFISHNLGAIASLCDRVGVLYAGRLVEEGPAHEIFRAPRHPYTLGLVRCLPAAGDGAKGGRRLDVIPGFPPAAGAPPPGCVFKPRCGLARPRCDEPPPLYPVAPGRVSRCHFHEETATLPFAAAPPALPPTTRAQSAVPALELAALSKTYQVGGRAVHALRDVSLTLREGETLGLVGESGSGKTTLAHALLGLLRPDEGSRIALDGRALESVVAQRSRDDVRAMQIVFQNPDSALNRSHSVRHLIGRAVSRLAGLAGPARTARVLSLLDAVRLPARTLSSRPRQLSGGMKQRVAVARAFAGDARLVVCDEPTSALDVSVQSAILNLFADLQAERRVSYVFISHDLGVVRYLSDRIAVLYLGRLLEVGPAQAVLAGPHHPYTEALLSAAPSISGERLQRIKLSGEIPSPLDPPSGCVFNTRCARKFSAICETEEPPFTPDESGHAIRCHLPRDRLGRMSTEAGQGAPV